MGHSIHFCCLSTMPVVQGFANLLQKNAGRERLHEQAVAVDMFALVPRPVRIARHEEDLCRRALVDEAAGQLRTCLPGHGDGSSYCLDATLEKEFANVACALLRGQDRTKLPA
jgi:hypothetical protein